MKKNIFLILLPFFFCNNVIAEETLNETKNQKKEMIKAFENKGKTVVSYDYKIDKGSFMYVEALIKKCINKKRSS